MSYKLVKGGLTAAAIVLIALLAVTPASAGDVLYGDANLSGAVNGADAGAVQLAVSGSQAVPPNADASGHDSAIRSSDLLAIRQYMALYKTDLPVTYPPVVNAISGISGPSAFEIVRNTKRTITYSLDNSIAPPRGGKSCAGISVNFTCTGCPAGTTVDSPALANAACQVTTTVNAGNTTGSGTITAGGVVLKRANGGVITTLTSPPTPVTVVPDCLCVVAGAPALLLSMPRNGTSNLPPDSVTKNMPVNAQLKFVYDQSIIITGASVSVGTISSATTNCGKDTIVWNAALAYDTSYTLSITGVVACDDYVAVPAINLSLRTARDVTSQNVSQNGEGFLEGSLKIRVVDDMAETVIPEAVVRINTSVTWDDPGWEKEDQAYNGGTITFMSTTVALNQPITVTVMAPGYEYLTLADVDAREMVLGLKLRGEGIADKQQTDIIGDFNPTEFDSIHTANTRGGIPNPIRFGMASLGFFRRTLTTLETKDIFGPNVQQTLTMLGISMRKPLPCNIHLPDMVSAREDIPAGATPAFAGQAFYRLRTDRVGEVYVAVNGATANIQLMVLTTLLAGGSLQDLISAIMMAGTHSDIQKVTIPDIGGGTCRTLIVDSTNHGLATDPFTGCTVVNDGRRMQLNHYSYGWQHSGDLWYTPGFSYDSAMRVNMSNWAYDPDPEQNYSVRRTCLDGYGANAPCRIPVLQLGILSMPDGTQVGISMAVQNLTTGTGTSAIASNLLGFPMSLSHIESDLGIPAGSIKVGVASTHFDWEIRFNALNDRNFAVLTSVPDGGCRTGPCFFVENSEWVEWIYGINPVDPGVPGWNEQGNPAVSPANDLVDRLFVVPEMPGSDDGTPPDPYFNTDAVMYRLLDSTHTLATCMEPSYKQSDYNGATPVVNPIDNSLWSIYAPAKLTGTQIRTHLPKVPTVAEINALGLTGANYTFETAAQTGIPNGFEIEWALNALNLPTNVTMNNILIRDEMLLGVRHASQNHQRFIFQNP